MKIYLITRNNPSWCEDWGMVVIAEDKLHAERCARVNSPNFEKIPKNDIKIKEIKPSREMCILKANVGS